MRSGKSIGGDAAPYWAIVRAWADPDAPANMKLINKVGRGPIRRVRLLHVAIGVVARSRLNAMK